jgi:hypothetical protein
MNIPQKHQAEVAAICDLLKQAVTAPSIEATRQILTDTLRRAERLAQSLADAPYQDGAQGRPSDREARTFSANRGHAENEGWRKGRASSGFTFVILES